MGLFGIFTPKISLPWQLYDILLELKKEWFQIKTNKKDYYFDINTDDWYILKIMMQLVYDEILQTKIPWAVIKGAIIMNIILLSSINQIILEDWPLPFSKPIETSFSMSRLYDLFDRIIVKDFIDGFFGENPIKEMLIGLKNNEYLFITELFLIFIASLVDLKNEINNWFDWELLKYLIKNEFYNDYYMLALTWKASEKLQNYHYSLTSFIKYE